VNWLHLVSSVRCLACGTVYPKPEAGGTAESNPGCPHCAYVGWIPADEDEVEDDELTEAAEPLRSDADRPRLRFWRAS
jgi:predicted  nucleic acid-binding Zn-ribbon protein